MDVHRQIDRQTSKLKDRWIMLFMLFLLEIPVHYRMSTSSCRVTRSVHTLSFQRCLAIAILISCVHSVTFSFLE